MRAFRFCGSRLSFLVAGVLLLGSSGVRADELHVMPYSCRVVGGQPVLTPAEDEGHPVIGHREQREFRACSPVDPDLCRRWTVHRFDLDCGGRRVPWVEVAAAAEATRDGRAFISGGRLELEMPARWSLPPDAPCARQGEFEGGMRRFCAERLARIRRVTVPMPAGFAPMLGVDGIFVKDSVPRGAMADAAPSRPTPASEPGAEAQGSEPIPPPHPKPIRKAPQKEPPAPQPPPQPMEASTPKAAPPPAPEPVKTEPSASGHAAEVAPVVPKIINSASAPEPPPDAKPSVGATGALPEPSVVSPASEGTAVQSEVAGGATSAPDRLALSESEAESPLLPVTASGGPLRVDATVITVASLAMLTLLTLTVVWRRRRVPPVPALSRDISAVSLGRSAAPDGERTTKGELTLVAEPLTGRDLDASPTLPGGSPVPLGDAMPRTREEALSVLGMGIAPDVNEAAIKKIIDGLRLSWHPDHARDPADRAMRELRLKQINAAWDIISGQGAG
ncbi:J domain-containing protein [Hyphomicrobium sp.]|uniref:J domain-containing protein n=1 Tax=Hyphomicrobium sp. TaxID=82 RepID=UPI0025BEFF99|nr:J domain-containing protein [Hyphomicrobium sp.]MCC7250262.1 hypothetical protein [Hyphomicrobium sp.]